MEMESSLIQLESSQIRLERSLIELENSQVAYICQLGVPYFRLLYVSYTKARIKLNKEVSVKSMHDKLGKFK